MRQAREKAEKLIAGLVAQQQDLGRFADQIGTDVLSRGQDAFNDAIESTRRTIDGIDAALRRSSTSSSGT